MDYIEKAEKQNRELNDFGRIELIKLLMRQVEDDKIEIERLKGSIEKTELSINDLNLGEELIVKRKDDNCVSVDYKNKDNFGHGFVFKMS